MGVGELKARQQPIELPEGVALGVSFRWPGGQYCAIHTDRGLVGCGIYDCPVASEFGLAVAIARGTPERPLCEPEDLLPARIVELTDAAAQLGIQVGMTGKEALAKMLAAR